MTLFTGAKRRGNSFFTKKTRNIGLLMGSCLFSPFSFAEYTLFDDKLRIDFLASQGYQDIQAKDGAFRPEDENQSANFLRLRVNLQLSFQITEDIRAYVDLGEEPNDFSSENDVNFTINQDFGGIDFELLGLSGHRSEDADLILSIGNIGMSAFQFKGFQDGAAVQTNPLIGNSPVDFATAEEGIQLAYNKTLSNSPIKSWRIAGTVTGSSFGEAFEEGRGFNHFITGTIETKWGVDFGINYLTSNQDGQVDISGDEIASLDGLVLPNYRFGDGENYNFSSSSTSSRETHVGLSPGLEFQIIALNVRYRPTNTTTLIGMLGSASDDYSFVDVNGDITAFQGATGGAVGVIKQDSKIVYYTLEAQQYIIPEKLYLAARYVNATNDSPGITSEDELTRLQISAGYWLTKKILFKAEYVNQDEDANSGGQIGGGFDGFQLEASVKF